MMDLISVIVPVYNTEKYLDRCIQSILAQTYSNIELLLIDDGSTDSSGAICDRYAGQDSRVRVFHKPNGGVSSARNMGLDNARGEWIIFCDSDDWIDAEMYEHMYNAAIQNKVDMVCCDLLVEEKNNKTILSYKNNYKDHKLMYDCLAPISVEYFAMCNKLVSRRVYDINCIRATEGANMWEDVELMTKIRYFSQSSCVINKPFYHYNRMNESSITSALKMLSRVEGQVERVKQIERFFIEQGAAKKYKHFISLLKFVAKYDLFGQYKWKWMRTFNEAKWSLHKLGNVFPRREILKFYLVSFFGYIVIPICKLCRK